VPSEVRGEGDAAILLPSRRPFPSDSRYRVGQCPRRAWLDVREATGEVLRGRDLLRGEVPAVYLAQLARGDHPPVEGEVVEGELGLAIGELGGAQVVDEPSQLAVGGEGAVQGAVDLGLQLQTRGVLAVV
jgi:hypothetical protein